MKVVYSAKYNDTFNIKNPFAAEVNVGHSASVFSVLKYITGLLLLIWLVSVSYFFVYPLLPNVQDIKSAIGRFDPYDIGYTVTTQLFVKLSPPTYSIAESIEEGQGNFIRTIEYVDPEGIELAGLESEDTTISISTAGILGPIVDGYTQEEMLRGFWHYPASAVPGEKGNTVIFGHRYHHLPPQKDTFFNLDSVKVGDSIVVNRGGEEISYTVVETVVVGKTEASILTETGDYRLTLVTCTPLWTADERLVVIAIQDRVSNVI